MMQKRQIFINAVMSTVEVLVISVVLFILYQFLLNTLGIDQLGIWSLVLTTTATTQIANFGLSGSVVKFVAKYIARGEKENVSGVIQTAAISIAFIVALVLVIGYPLIKKILALVVPSEYLPLALEILPYAFLALWFAMVTGVFQAGLYGRQRIDVRSGLLIMSSILNLLMCFILVPTYGLLGVAYARVLQVSVMFLVSWFLLRRYVPLPILPYRWSKRLFKEILGYGISFQTISVTMMLYDPITKALLSRFGDLSMVGYYEMANRMVQQFRALIVSANQVLVPAVADLKERTPEKIQSVYFISYQLLFYLALPLYSLIIVCTPIISEVWIGHYEETFVLFGILLSLARFLNTLEVPVYFVYLGIGELYWNVISHLTKALLNVGLGFLLGILYGGIGVVVAWVVSLVFGSGIVCLSYHIKNKIPLIELLPKASRMMVAICLFGILFSITIQHKLARVLNPTLLNSMVFFVFSIIIFVPFWLHPMRKRLIGRVTNELLNRKQGVG